MGSERMLWLESKGMDGWMGSAGEKKGTKYLHGKDYVGVSVACKVQQDAVGCTYHRRRYWHPAIRSFAVSAGGSEVGFELGAPTATSIS